jgi:hypothetical protein
MHVPLTQIGIPDPAYIHVHELFASQSDGQY